jgi:NAD(P)-dependent dehydrogenase (short-subunit alcohol dehydrogenase family)
VSAHTGEDPIARTITTLRGIESQGAEVDTWSADVSDLASMRAMLDAVAQRWHRIDGVVHAAGLRSGWTFAPIANLSTDAFVEQGRAKAEGARVLAELLDGRRLDFCVLMSSLSTALGGLGFGAYASANAFLDAVASAESRRSGVPWISVAWDGWAFPEDGLAQGAAERLAMRPEEGQEVFRRLLDSTPAARVIVSTADLDERAARTRVTLDSRAPATPHHRPEDKPYVAPRTDLERTLAGIWQELIGLERVSIHDDFFDLGGHSLLGTQMLSRVRDRIRGPVALADLFAAPTVAELASRIEMKSPSAELPAEKGMPG